MLRIEVALCIQRDKMDFFTLRTKWKSSKMFDSAIIIINEVLQTILPIYVFWVDVETRHLFEELAENTIFIWLYAAPPHLSLQHSKWHIILSTSSRINFFTNSNIKQKEKQ